MLVPWRVHFNDQFPQITHVGSFEMVGHHLPGIYVLCFHSWTCTIGHPVFEGLPDFLVFCWEPKREANNNSENLELGEKLWEESSQHLNFELS